MKTKNQFWLTVLLSAAAFAFSCQSLRAQDSTHWQRDMVLGNSTTTGSSRSSSTSGRDQNEEAADRIDDQGRASMATGDYEQALEFFKEAYDKSQLERYAKIYRKDIAWAKTEIAYHAVLQQGNDAWERRDFREALRLAILQQTIRDGPNVRSRIKQLNALIVWSEAKTAADYRRAIRMVPGLFTPDNVRFVDGLERMEKAALKARTKYNELASSLDTAPPKPGWFVSQDRILRDLLGGHTAEAHLEFSYANTPEALSEQARQGFDTTGALKGSQPVTSDTVPPEPASEAAPVVLEKFRKDPRITELQKRWKAAKIEQVTAQKKLDVIRQLKGSPFANKAMLDVKEARIRTNQDAAQSKLNTIKVLVVQFNVARL
jgi:hypothetical protein